MSFIYSRVFKSLFIIKSSRLPGKEARACNPSYWGWRAGGLQFKASAGKKLISWVWWYELQGCSYTLAPETWV
jgi:hypothetical protein